MSTQRFTPEFKSEAIRQVVEPGYTVAEIAVGLGVSTQSLCKWVKAVDPDESEKRASELLEAKSEILRLRAYMRRLEQEWDIVKKPRDSLPGSPIEVPLHQQASPPTCNHHEVSGIADCPCRVLSMAAQACQRLRTARQPRDSYVASRGVYGARRVLGDLREAGEPCGKHRVASLIRIHKSKAPLPIARRLSIIAPNHLNREFTVDAPNKAWVTDIIYIRTRQGWLYRALVVDLCARKVVGWAMTPTLARELTLDALLIALWGRKPKERVIVHSDQGSQYGSDKWKRFCAANKLDTSISRRDKSWDNAVAESFFSNLKYERIRKRIYKNRNLAWADVFVYIKVLYNRTRRHRHLGGISLDTFEQVSL